MHVDKFLNQRIQAADFPSLTQADLQAMDFTIGDIHRFRRHFPVTDPVAASSGGTGEFNPAMIGQLMEFAQADRLSQITSILERMMHDPSL